MREKSNESVKAITNMKNYSNHIDADDNRVILKYKKLAKLRQETINNCKFCLGSGYKVLDGSLREKYGPLRYPCQCQRRYRILFQLITAGVSKFSANELLYKKTKELRVVEIDLFTSDPIDKKPVGLYSKILDQYMRDRGRVMKGGYSLLFLGTNGTGKTFSSQKVILAFLSFGFSAHYITLKQYMFLYNEMITSKTEEKQFYKALIEEIKECDLVVIDELMKEDGSVKHVVTVLEEIIKRREADGLPTILISNANSPEGLKETYGIHVMSGLYRRYRAFYFDTKRDMRKESRIEWF